MRAEVTATTQPFAIKMATAAERQAAQATLPRLHLVRLAPRWSWCGRPLRATQMGASTADVTCKRCLQAIAAARREMAL